MCNYNTRNEIFNRSPPSLNCTTVHVVLKGPTLLHAHSRSQLTVCRRHTSTDSSSAWTCICVQGMSLDLKLTTPGSILEANAGFHREISLTQIEGQTIEEELSWSVDSQLEVCFLPLTSKTVPFSIVLLICAGLSALRNLYYFDFWKLM